MRGRSAVPEILPRMRVLILLRLSILEIIVLCGLMVIWHRLLAGLAADNLAHELDTFAFVGFGLAQGADFGAHLTKELLVAAFEDDQRVLLRSLLASTLTSGKLQIYGVREAQCEFEHVVGSCGAVAHTYEFHFLAVALVNAFHHVVDQSAVETVLAAVLDVVAGAADVYVVVFYVTVRSGLTACLSSPWGLFYELLRCWHQRSQ